MGAPSFLASRELVARADELVDALQPDHDTYQRRLALHAYMRRIIERALPQKARGDEESGGRPLLPMRAVARSSIAARARAAADHAARRNAVLTPRRAPRSPCPAPCAPPHTQHTTHTYALTYKHTHTLTHIITYINTHTHTLTLINT